MITPRTTLTTASLLALLIQLTFPPPALAAVPAALNTLRSPADLAALLDATTNPVAKKALQTHSAALLAAASRKPHVDHVIATLDRAPGSYTRTNTTPADLQQAFGGPLPLFDTLKMVNLGNSTLGVKAKRETDPFNQSFYEHLAQIRDLESLTILNTTAQNDWLIPLTNLHSLTRLDIINQARLNDTGLAHLASLKQLERFAFIGTTMTGKPFKDFAGWTRLKSSSFRGSKIDDEGLQYLCERFPNYETLSLAHAHFTDDAAVHLAKLKHLKGLELGSNRATSQSLRHLVNLPLEYFQLGEGVDSPGAIPILREIKTLKRLTLTNCKTLTDADLAAVASMTHLEHLELSGLPLPVERLPVLKQFAFLKSMRLVPPYPAELQTAIKQILPKVTLRFD